MTIFIFLLQNKVIKISGMERKKYDSEDRKKVPLTGLSTIANTIVHFQTFSKMIKLIICYNKKITMLNMTRDIQDFIGADEFIKWDMKFQARIPLKIDTVQIQLNCCCHCYKYS